MKSQVCQDQARCRHSMWIVARCGFYSGYLRGRPRATPMTMMPERIKLTPTIAGHMLTAVQVRECSYDAHRPFADYRLCSGLNRKACRSGLMDVASTTGTNIYSYVNGNPAG